MQPGIATSSTCLNGGFSEPLLQLCKQKHRSWSRCQDVPLAPLLQHLRRSRIFLCQSGLACFEKASTAAEKLGNVHQYTGTAGLQASRATLPRKQPFRGWHCRVSPVMPSLARLLLGRLPGFLRFVLSPLIPSTPIRWAP